MLKSLTITLFILAVFIPILSAEPYPYAQEDNIINLGEPTWDHAIEDFYEGLIVYFYEPYCLPCREFWPKLVKAAQQLKKPEDNKSPSNVQIAKVECHDEVKLCEAKGVSSYPTIMLYRQYRAPYEYRGDRETDAFRKWVRKVIDDDYEEVTSNKELFKRYSLAVLLAEGNDNVKIAYKDFIDDIEIADNHSELKMDIGDQGAIVTSESVVQKFTSGKSVEEIKNSINEALEKVVPTFGANHSRQLQGKENRNYLLYFRTTKFSYDSLSAREFEKFSDLKDIEKAYVNVVGDILGKTMAKLLGVKEDDESTVAYVAKEGKVLKKFKITGEAQITQDNMKNLKEKAQNRYYMSAESVKPIKKGEIQELTGKDFKRLTSETKSGSGANVFVMFYFPWCEWCIKLEPTWKALAYRYRDNNDLIIARIDMSENDAEGYELSEYPVLVFFEAKNGAEAEEYLSERSMRKLKEYLEKKVPSIKSVEL